MFVQMKTEAITQDLTEEDRLDVTLVKRDKALYKFALNYRAWMDERWNEVYRVDNYHGFLHEQKYWRSPEPIPINDKENWSLRMVIKYYVDEIMLNFRKYRKYYEKTLEKNRTEQK